MLTPGINLTAAIKSIYPDAVFMTDFWVSDIGDGNGSFISEWGYSQPQPTIDQLNAAWAVVQLSAAKSIKTTSLQGSYSGAVSSPVAFTNAAGVASTYPSGSTIGLNGATAVANLQAMISAGASAWKLGTWTDENNVNQVFTYADVQGLAEAMAAQGTAAYKNLAVKIAEVAAATTVNAVNAITW